MSNKHRAEHFFYAAGWKKFEPLWNLMIRARQLRCTTPLLESVLSKLTDDLGARLSAAGRAAEPDTG